MKILSVSDQTIDHLSLVSNDQYQTLIENLKVVLASFDEGSGVQKVAQIQHAQRRKAYYLEPRIGRTEHCHVEEEASTDD